MKILSYGDLIPCGHYRLHSKFRNVFNFERGGRIISVVTEKIGRGPLNIVLKRLPKSLSGIKAEKSFFILDENKLPRHSEVVYDSVIPVSRIIPMELMGNMQVVRRTLSAVAPGKSLAFLLDKRREREFRTSFERAFLEKMKDGVVDIAFYRFSRGVRKIKGLGFGLTPSGDDFIAGYLLGVNMVQKLFKLDLKKIRRTISANAFGKNPVSNSFIHCSAEGRASEKVNKLLSAICRTSKDEIEKRTVSAIQHGHTSGADLAVGILYGFYGGINAFFKDDRLVELQ